jgi:hypothetical protein
MSRLLYPFYLTHAATGLVTMIFVRNYINEPYFILLLACRASLRLKRVKGLTTLTKKVSVLQMTIMNLLKLASHCFKIFHAESGLERMLGMCVRNITNGLIGDQKSHLSTN